MNPPIAIYRTEQKPFYIKDTAKEGKNTPLNYTKFIILFESTEAKFTLTFLCQPAH